MKRILLLAALVQLSASAFTQEYKERAIEKQIGLDKAKKTIKVGWIIMGSGTVCLIGALVTAQPDTDDNPSDNTVSTVLLFTGLTAFSVGVITLAIGAANRDKYNRIVGKMERIPVIKGGSLVYRRIPAISLQIRL